MNLSEKSPVVIDLENIFQWLEEKGRSLYGKNFNIHPQDYELIFKLMVYLYRDEYHAAKYGIDLRKGLLLTGPVGCGKTTLMSIIRRLEFPSYNYELVSAREICLRFMESGHAAIKYYSSFSAKAPQVFCFDDLGTETAMKYFGNETNVMGEIMLLRYDLFIHQAIPTHITTNLSASELEKQYGSRVRSRMREMFNLFAFGSTAADKRA